MVVQKLSKNGLLFSSVFLFFALFFFCLDDENGKRDEKAQITVSGNVSECTFVNELISVGFSESEALQNIHSCKDRACPFHHSKSHINIAFVN
jgi:hypothetical protein